MAFKGQNSLIHLKKEVPQMVTKIKFCTLFALILLFNLLTDAYAESIQQKLNYPINDAHLHYVNFVQGTHGIEALIKGMDRYGVQHSMITGVPVVKKWDSDSPVRPVYYLDTDSQAYWYSATDMIVARAVLSLPEGQRSRLHPFICGFNPTDRNAIDHVKRMLEWYPDLWEGIGEVFLRHDDLSAYTYGGGSRADDIAMDPIYELAAEKDFPVVLHSNAGSSGLREAIYVPELERAIKKHPKTRFVWAQIGIARRIDITGLSEICDRLLSTYDNLYVDLTSHLYELYLVKNGKLQPEWVALFEKHPRRFMVGSDVIGHFTERYGDKVMRNQVILEALTPATRDRIARDNFISILPQRVQRRMVK